MSPFAALSRLRSCAAACTTASCSCTQSFVYWSSTTYQNGTPYAWYVYFGDGYVGTGFKTDSSLCVRAVRGGS
jgi:hypothetical protein